MVWLGSKIVSAEEELFPVSGRGAGGGTGTGIRNRVKTEWVMVEGEDGEIEASDLPGIPPVDG
jgi:hypothetical protein